MLTLLVCFLAGMGAGLGTGFAGMSAAAVISPMLITFLGLPAYEAVGIPLASDVLASAVSAYTYGKNKNLDMRNGLVMMAAVLVFTMVGSFVASLVPNTTMGSFSMFMTLLLGIKFIVKPVMTTKDAMGSVSHFAIGGMPNIFCLILCVAFTLLWARVAAKFANKASPATLNRITGVILAVLGVVILAVNYLK
mgnify:FL=1